MTTPLARVLAMEPRERDAQIAVRLFGWQLFPYMMANGEPYLFCPPGERVHISTTAPVLDYSTKVLAKAQEWEGTPKFDAFCRHLAAQCHLRDTEFNTIGTLAIIMRELSVGMITCAALATLLEAEEAK